MGRLLVVIALAGCGTEDLTDSTKPSTPTTPTPVPTQVETGADTGTPTTPGPELTISGIAWDHDETYGGPFTVSWLQSGPGVVRVGYQIDGEWRHTPDIDGQKGVNHTTVIGVPLGEDAPYRVEVDDGERVYDAGSPLVARPIPPGLPLPAIQIADPALWRDSGEYVLLPINDTGNGDAYLVVLDRDARPVWATSARNILYTELSATGEGILWADTVRDVAFRSYLDQPIEEVDVPGHYHAMVGLPDGTIAWPSGNDLFELAPGAVAPTVVWSNSNISYVNGLTYHAATDRYGVSSYSAQSIASVDRAAAEVLWSAPGFVGEPLYGFQPADSRLINQHGIEYLDNGNILASSIDANTGSVWAREFVVNDRDEALRAVWEHDSGWSDVSWSWVHRLPSGNTLHTLGPGGLVYEVTASGDVAWGATSEHWLGRAQIIDDLYTLVAP